MSFNYWFIEHTADIAFQAEADTVEELFTASAYGWKETLLEETVIEAINEKEIILSESSLEELLVYFLDELNFLLNTKKWILSSVTDIKIKNEKDIWHLSAKISGEELNPGKHEIKVEIKAVTFHQMDVKYENEKYRTRVVFDI
ncbi:MAG: archease [Ignavibacteriaceae bacterium]